MALFTQTKMASTNSIKRWLGTVLVLAMIALVTSAGPVRASTAASSTNTINFQGEVTDSSGNPLNGNYNMRFAIYDTASGGTKWWPAFDNYEEHQGVLVTRGLFNVLLGSQQAIDVGVFYNGGDRYLQIWVCTSAGASCSTYDDLGRLPIASAAYAQVASTFLPGVTVSRASGTVLTLQTADTAKPALAAEASAASGTTAAVAGTAKSPGGAGLAGYNDSSGYGIYGRSLSGTGVYGTAPMTGTVGIATATNGATIGVYGESRADQGIGVGGKSPSIGVYGSASGNSQNFGVVGYTESNVTNASGVYGTSTAGATNGVWGQTRSTSDTATGVYGLATGNSGQTNGVYGRTDSASDGAKGVYGLANATGGQTYGVYGKNNSASGYGVYSDGNAHVEGQLTWKAQTSYASIAFINYEDTENSTQEPIQLPHGATITKMTLIFKDDDANGNLSAILWRVGASGFSAMARADGSTGQTSAVATSISHATVDNSQYGYYVDAFVHQSGVNFSDDLHPRAVVIEYTIERPH